MARLFAIMAGLSTIAAASALYSLKHDTRRIEAEMHARERAIEKTESDIAALKSERAYLGRPERIDAEARAQGLRPIGQGQYRRLAPQGTGETTTGGVK